MRTIFTFIFLTLLCGTLWSQPINRQNSSSFSFHKNHSKHLEFNLKSSIPDDRILHPARRNNKPKIADTRSFNSLKQRLDSIINKGAFGGLELVNDYKDVFVYNANGNVTTYTDFIWNETENKWENSSKEEYTYDVSGNMSSDSYYEWNDADSKWDNYEKVEYQYDAGGKLSVETVIDWNTISGTWEDSYKNMHTYDQNGREIEMIMSMWDESTGNWMNMLKYLYTSNSNGDYVTILIKFYDDSSDQWVDFSKDENSYDDTGHLLLYTSATWDESQNEWIYDIKDENTFDTNGNMTTHIQSSWDLITGDWASENKEEYVYDSYGNRSENRQYDWDPAMQVWVLASKSTQSFDNSYGFADLILPWYYIEDASEMFIHKFNEFSFYSYNGAGWELYETTNLYYSPVNTTDVKDQKIAKISVYPNPADDFVIIESGIGEGNMQLEILDNLGKKVKQQAVTTHQIIDMKHFPAGLYYYRVKDRTGVVQTGKIMLK